MSDAFVDVSWRGLEVGKRIKLHAVHPAELGGAYLDHGTPMPVGTALMIRTDEGLEIAATVVRVHEQVGGSTEVPGMQVVPKALEGEAKAWWSKLELPPSPAPAAAPVPVPVPASPPPSPPSDPRAEITNRPTLTMSTVEMERALAAAGAPVNSDASRTELMPAINSDTLDGVVVDTTAVDDGLVDDGRRTMAMSAIDISAIVEAGESETSGPIGNGNGDDDGPSGDGPSGDGSGDPGASSSNNKKRGRGKRNKRR
jgi:hypothetical protein